MHGNGDGPPPFSIIAEKAVPEFYADSVNFELSVYGATLEFGKLRKPPPNFTGPPPSTPVAVVHMSPQHAKVMAKLFFRSMKEYEAKVGKINIPGDLLAGLGLEEEWQ